MGFPSVARRRYSKFAVPVLDALCAVRSIRIEGSANVYTRYMDAALNHLRSQGTETKPEDVARLSPLADKHFNVLGRYHFTVTDSILRGELRPLRIPDAPEELFWAVGA